MGSTDPTATTSAAAVPSSLTEAAPAAFPALPRVYNAASDLLDRHVVEGRGDRIAVIDDVGATTYAELAKRASRIGNTLRAMGVQREQRVLLCMLDTVDFPAVFLGAMKIGAVPVPVNTLLTSADLTHLVCDSRATTVVVSDALLAKLEPALAASPWLERVLVSRSSVGGDAGKYPWLDDAMQGANDALEAVATCPDDVAFWLYSSGSTGAPKGAIHLHAHLAHTARLYGQATLGVCESDRVFSAAKLFFAYGLGNAMTFPFSVGATAILMAERATPAAVMRTMRAHQPTLFGGVPTLFASILADAAHHPDTGSAALRACMSAGEALPKHVGERWRERFGVDILDGIGSTEMLHIFLSNRHADVRYGTSGRPVDGYELRLLDESGAVVADGDEGDLWVNGPSSAVAYWNQREKSLATFHGPWTRTGDRYARDADGYYTYAGRGDDMLKVSGIWVSPFEVESALSAHEAILEAAVVGFADEDGLIKPRAFVVTKRAEDQSETLKAELKAFVKERLAPYKYPRWIEFIDELPKTATGKIQRFRLRS